MKACQTGVPEEGLVLEQQESDDDVVLIKKVVCFFAHRALLSRSAISIIIIQLIMMYSFQLNLITGDECTVRHIWWH